MDAVLTVSSSLDHDGDELVRYSVMLNNGEFSASISAWGNVGEHIEFAAALEGFPASSDSTLRYRFGTPGTGACHLHFFCIDSLGHVGVWADFESTYSVGRSERHETASLFMRCDPATIHEFVAGLRRFVAGSANQAMLPGQGA